MAWHPAPTVLAPMYWSGGDPALASGDQLAQALLIPAGTWQITYMAILATDAGIDPRPNLSATSIGIDGTPGGRFHLLGDGLDPAGLPAPPFPLIVYNAAQLVTIDDGDPLEVTVAVGGTTDDASAFAAQLAVVLTPATPIATP